MKQLSDILYKVPITALSGRTDLAVQDVQLDSRKIKAGSLFIAVKGAAADGHRFIATAVEQGAVAIVCETLPAEKSAGVTYVQTSDSAMAAGLIAHNFYDQPTAALRLVGVTGTNGKTTIATLLYKLFTALGYECGLVSKIGRAHV